MSATAFPPDAADERGPADREIIYLVAPGGNPNYGDEFILRAWLRHLARVRPDADVIVDCHTPGQASVLLRRWHPRVSFVDTVWRVCFDTTGLPPADAVAAAEESVRNPGRIPRIASGIDLLTRAGTVHLVGGGYINAVWAHHLALLATVAAAVEHSGGRAIATGQGLLPVGDDNRLEVLRTLAARFTMFDVRDSPSRSVIAGAGGAHTFTGDDAWLGIGNAGVYDTESPAAQRPYVFCLQSDLMEDFADGQGTTGLAQAITALIERWALRGEDVAVVEGIPGPDRIIFDQIAHLLPGVIFVPFTELWLRGLPARAGQVWVSTRFHPHLLAAATGASGIALSGRTDYYPIKHQSLIESGSRWQLSDSSDLAPTPPDAGGFTDAEVHALRQRKSELAADIYPPAPQSVLRRAAAALRRAGRR